MIEIQFLSEKELQEILGKDPAEYIDFCVYSTLTQGQKAKLTNYWLTHTNYTINDIQYARNRHEYWKKKKMNNSAERAMKRFAEYNFADKKNKKWQVEELEEFLKLNEIKKDRELAEHFNRSIPSIQYIRRCINLVKRIYDQGLTTPEKHPAPLLIKNSEKKLREIVHNNKKL